MAENDTQNKQPTSPILMIAILAGIAIIGAGAYFYAGNSQSSDDVMDEVASIDGDYPPMPEAIEGGMTEQAGTHSNGIEPAASEETADMGSDVDFSDEEMLNADGGATDVIAEPEATPAKTGLDAFLADRAVGDPSAPVRVDEFASLTCSHCASFHNNTYADFKEKYIDTGKVYFVFNDFPLDKAALDASITARCLPEDKYEAFIKLLFATQRQWAAEGYMKALKQNAKLAGLGDEEFDECHENEAYKKGLESKIQTAREQHDIQSTPTFIMNDGEEMIRGASSLKTFDQVIGKLLAAEEAN